MGARYRGPPMRRLPSTAGVEVAVHDLGGSGRSARSLLFAHATGFCAGVFSPAASVLAASFHCVGLDLRGHGYSTLPVPPGTEGIWQGFTDDVLAAVDGLRGLNGVEGLRGPNAVDDMKLDTPVGVGHSSGGAALLMAEAARPGTFSALWCFEPIVWPDPSAARGRAERMAEGAGRRRDRFPSRADAHANFAAKPPFSILAPAALRGYVDCGFADEPDGSVTLRCPRDVEAAIYLRALDDDRFGRLPDIRCPVVVACGAVTDAITPEISARLADAVPAGRLRLFDGLGHLGPLEDPEAVAKAILDDLG